MGHQILITGGAGFIGSHLADALLARGHRVRVLDNLSPQVHGERAGRPEYLSGDVELLVGDVRDPSAVTRALTGVEAVFHLAAAVGVGQSMYELAHYTAVNNLGTAVLLEALIARPEGRLVVASSMSIYGEGLYRRPDGTPCVVPERALAQLRAGEWEVRGPDGTPLVPAPTPESKTPSLASVYALSKYDQERMCLLTGRAYGIPTAALRFFNVYGTRQALSNPYTGVLAIFAARLVTFGYQPDRPVIHALELSIRPGETVALIGPSGSGKSTLAVLLQRLYPLTGGEILVDGIDIRQMTQHSLRGQIGVVPQDPYIFNDTVRANISYGRPHASMAEIEAAAAAAHAHGFIAALPEGYDTVLRERGSRLSGGQRQRIAIARALLRNPPILVLDEATSALDSESEHLVQRALRRLLQGRTAIVIAHRLATVQEADRIVVLQDGRISEQGSPTELLEADGYYASVVRRQREGFLGLDEGKAA